MNYAPVLHFFEPKDFEYVLICSSLVPYFYFPFEFSIFSQALHRTGSVLDEITVSAPKPISEHAIPHPNDNPRRHTCPADSLD